MSGNKWKSDVISAISIMKALMHHVITAKQSKCGYFENIKMPKKYPLRFEKKKISSWNSLINFQKINLLANLLYFKIPTL